MLGSDLNDLNAGLSGPVTASHTADIQYQILVQMCGPDQLINWHFNSLVCLLVCELQVIKLSWRVLESPGESWRVLPARR